MRAERRVPGERAERHDHANRFQQPDLPDEVRQAVVALGGGRPVRRRRATHRGGDVAPGQPQPVVARDRGRLVREPGPVQRPEQPVARPVAGEDPSRAVAPVGGRRQPDHEHRAVRIPEPGQRPAPVLLATRTPRASRARPPPARPPAAGSAGTRSPRARARAGPRRSTPSAPARNGARSTRGRRRTGSAPTTTRSRGTSRTVRSSPSSKRTCARHPSACSFSLESE